MSAPDEHGHDYSGRGHEHGHEHAHEHGLLATVKGLFAPHSHDSSDKVDDALEASDRGIRALKVSLVVLGATAVAQAFVVVLTGSVALLGDTLHNVADALTALPLWLAFAIGRRRPTRRYTYGYGRAEDLAGIAIVLTIAASAALAGYEAVKRLLDPHVVRHVGAVAAAAIVGFVGNEVVARYRIRVGRDIGSAALVADGLHARTDGFTSLAVLFGAVGVWLGWPQADPVVGLLITVAILVVLRNAARDVYLRLMDAVDESLVDAAEAALRNADGVEDVTEVRIRWIGHALRAEARITVDPDLSLVDAHDVAEHAEHALLHDVPKLSDALVHADPRGDHHRHTASHRR